MADPGAETKFAALWRVLKAQGIGGWALIVILTVLLVFSVVIAYAGWTSAAGTAVPIAGYVAMALGVIFSLAVGFGLMGLVFYSSRHGYDESPKAIDDDTPPA